MEKIMNFINPKPAGALPELLQLDDIIIENSLNPREGALDQEVIWDYAAHVDDLPAMHVFQMEQDNRFYLVSGFHRIAAHRAAGRSTAAFVVHTGTMDEAREFADLDNLKHGLRLTRAERRLVIERQLKRHPDWSDVRIATACYTTDKTVRTVRENLELRSEIPRMDRLVGADGIERPRAVPRPAAEQQVDDRQATFESSTPITDAGVSLPEEEKDIAINDPAIYDAMNREQVAAVESTVPAAPPPPPLAKAALPPPVISEAPWSIQITIRPNGGKPLISIWHGQEQKVSLPAELAARVMGVVGEHTEPIEAEAPEAEEEAPVAEPEWLIGK